MKFSLLVFVNVAATVFAIEPGQDLLPVLRKLSVESKQCLHLDNPEISNTLRSIGSCLLIPEKKNLQFLKDAAPYLCLLTLNMIIDSCLKRVPLMKKDQYDANELNICSLNYARGGNHLHLDVNLNKSIDFLRADNKCDSVCHMDQTSSQDCINLGRLVKLTAQYTFQSELHPVRNESHVFPQLGGTSERQATISQSRTANMGWSQNREHFPGMPPAGRVGDEIPAVQPNENNVPIRTHSKDAVPIEKIPTKYDSKSEKSGSTKVAELNGGFKTTNNGNLNSVSINSHAQLSNNGNNKMNGSLSVAHKPEENPNVQPGYGQGSELREPVGMSDAARPLIETSASPDKDIEDHPVDDFLESKKNDLDDNSQKLAADDIENDDNNENGELDLRKEEMGINIEKDSPSAQYSNVQDLESSKTFFQAEDSHFSAYFLMTVSVIIIGYIIYHNKNKILAYALEGRRTRNGRRRPTSASYRKLDCNLEEAIASNPSHASVTNVVY